MFTKPIFNKKNRKSYLGFYSLILVCVFGVALCLCSNHAFAVNKNQSLYKVSNIQVDTTDKTAVSAREKGLRTARLKAFRTLAKRVLSKSEYLNLEIPSDQVIQNMIQGMQISNEKMADNRYIAEATFRFNVGTVSDYFGETGHAVIQEASRPTLIIPFYQDGNETILWDERNIWRKAWDKKGSSVENLSALTPIYLPLGDLQDMNEIKDINTLTSGRSKIIEMGNRYGAYQVLASIFMEDPKDEAEMGGRSARIFVFGYNQDPTVQVSDTLMVQGGTKEELLDKGMTAMVEWLEENWKQLNLAQSENQQIIPVEVVFQNLGHWVSLSERLREISVVEAVEVERLKQGSALTNIEYRGSIDGLKIALQKEGFNLQVFQQTLVHEEKQSAEDRLMSGLFGDAPKKHEEVIRTYRITDMK